MEISFLLAFLAGVVSFVSPCILPLIPGYISLVTKKSFEQLYEDDSKEGRIKYVLLPSIVFILGFSTVFVLLGASASFLGSFMAEYKALLFKISGLLIIFFGLYTTNILKIKQLNIERRIMWPSAKLGHFGTFLFGVAFGFGWTPCVGPILASILLYASTSEGIYKGAGLLFTYSVGLGLPFLITGLTLTKALGAFKFIKKNYRFYNLIVGGMLMIVGILMLTNYMYYINIYGQKIFDLAGLNFWQSF